MFTTKISKASNRKSTILKSPLIRSAVNTPLNARIVRTMRCMYVHEGYKGTKKKVRKVLREIVIRKNSRNWTRNLQNTANLLNSQTNGTDKADRQDNSTISFEKLRYTLSNLDVTPLASELKNNDPNAVRKSKRFLPGT